MYLSTPAGGSEGETVPILSKQHRPNRLSINQKEDSASTTSSTTSYGGGTTDREVYSMNMRLLKRFWRVFGPFVVRSVWHWVGVLGLVITAGVHSWLSGVLGTYMGKFYSVVSEPGSGAWGIYYVLIITALIYIGLAFEQAATKTISGALSVHVRRKVTNGIYTSYFQNITYYKISLNDKVKNPDQQLTQDIDRYSITYGEFIADVVSSPVFICYFWYQVTVLVNFWVPFIVLGYYLVSFVIQKFVMSPISYHTYTQEKLEGEFRQHHQKINNFAESIALSNGGNTEAAIGQNIFSKVLSNKMQVVYWEFLLWFLSYFFSYGASLVGSIVVVIPILVGDESSLDYASVTTSLYDIGMLAWGFTKVTTVTTSLAEFSGYVHRIGELAEIAVIAQEDSPPKPPANKEFLECNSVSISDPDGHLLLHDVTFKADRDILIMGPTGSGKTSLLRALGLLWPISLGSITLPLNPKTGQSNLFFLPQKVHLPWGNIVQQIVYPLWSGEEEHSNSNKETNPEGKPHLTTEMVNALLKEVGLECLLERDDLYIRTDWDFLSPGQKQCLAASRVLFHSPPLVILDEVTSQVDSRAEGAIYEAFKRRGILKLSIGHRTSLKKFHETCLVVDAGTRTLREEEGEWNHYG